MGALSSDASVALSAPKEFQFLCNSFAAGLRIRLWSCSWAARLVRARNLQAFHAYFQQEHSACLLFFCSLEFGHVFFFPDYFFLTKG